MSLSEPIVHSALYQQVADRVRGLIYSHQLAPGSAVDEKALCERFGISRTPMREALKVLAAEGLVELVPRRGCFVRRLEMDELAELFPVMAVLEGLCAREAVKRLDAEGLARLDALHADLESHAADGEINAYYETNLRFHQAVADLSGNRWLQRSVSDLRKIMRLARHTQLTLPGRLRHSLEEHRRIMAAFRQHDVSALDACMQDHLNKQWQALADAPAGELPTDDNDSVDPNGGEL